ncbi:MAG: O-antigen ligase family protein, partial [Proteobacteria bacterium]|nr:O-antigen ligase family protein [Pseudomonadota bacterium]
GSLVPIGVVLGNVSFEGFVGLTGLSWLLRSILAFAWKEPGVGESFDRLKSHPLVLPYFVWYVVILISFFCNAPDMDKLGYNIAFIRHLLFVAAAVDISQRLPVCKYFLYGLAGGVLWAGINTLAVHLAGFDLIGNPISYYNGKRQAAPRIAWLASLSAPFFWGWAVATFHKHASTKKHLFIERRETLVTVTLIAVVLILISDIRTFILAMVIGLFWVSVLSGKKALVKNIFILGGVTVVIGVLFFNLDSFQRIESINHRFYIWKVSWLMSIDHPIIGTSVSAYKEVFSQYASADLAAMFNLSNPSDPIWAWANSAHNLFLMVFTVTGVSGLLAFLWLLINAIRSSWQPNQLGWSLGLASWPATFLAIGMVGTNIYDGTSAALFVFFLGLIGGRDNAEELSVDSEKRVVS